MDPIEQALQRTLVVRCQLGDRRAMEELFLRYNRAIGFYAQRMLNREDVEDVQQEVWLSVLRRIAQLRSPEAFVVWLYRIARNKIVARISELQRISLLEDPEVRSEDASNVETEFLLSDAQRIREELLHLTPKHREVMLLRFMESMSCDQIAEVLGCTSGTVRSRLHYAKLALRKLLEADSCQSPQCEPPFCSKTG